MTSCDIVIVGGGLAGLTAAIELSKNYSVTLIEKNDYPSHKVCGEYISREVEPYLKTLGIDLNEMGLPMISKFSLSTVDGEAAKFDLPLGGFGISRYLLDLRLFQEAGSNGCHIVKDSVERINFENNSFTIHTKAGKSFHSAVCLGAYGKRSNLDHELERDFISDRSSWLAVKGHYRLAHFPDNLVALHNFRGGYAGISKVENGRVNFCYLADYQSFKQERNVNNFNRYVLRQNPFLANFLDQATPIFEKSLTIAQISFQRKELIKDHVMMCGDSAGLIHPLCGNGMAMAVHAAKIASEAIKSYLTDAKRDRSKMEREYSYRWNHTFRSRLTWSRRLQSVMLNRRLASAGMKMLAAYPFLATNLIKTTHGKPVVC
ncbi:NAD(P)/FAD-dependent oxidoreductase [Robertkochia aurantiaca]|uniref:NAD(P)/FAD-dependent oxidoreductase n=1 Tax=Robertkochia aurantiaca TaxID=2873700 RepID=UPI001CCEFB24|nr:NAD(P)/FAD-dependent oxidoreductase [Robertkochia sp. 3YJGBD-33]